MDNRSLLTKLIVLILFYSADGFAEKRDFRNVRWGMTRLEVMANEEIAPEAFELAHIFYKPEIEGRTFYLIYEFVENRLTNAEYVFASKDRGDYLWLKKCVAIKYGSPFSSHDGGLSSYKYKWKNTETEIVLKPLQTRGSIIKYTGRKYQYLKTEREEKNSLAKMNEIDNAF